MSTHLLQFPPAPRLTSLGPTVNSTPTKPQTMREQRINSRLEAAATLVTQSNALIRGDAIPQWASKVEWTK